MLSEKQIEQFRNDGYLVFERLIHGEKLAHYKSVFDGLVARGKKMPGNEPHWSFEMDSDGNPIQGFLHKIQGVCVVEPEVLRLAREPEILEQMESLVGPNIDVFGTKFFPKLPNGGTSTSWHQDSFYFGTDSDRIVSCAIYLEDTDLENGCLKVVPGSHRQGIVGHEKRKNKYGQWTQVDEAQAVDLVVPGGTVVFFSTNILHGTHDNHSNRTRYSTAWHYMPGELETEKFIRGKYEDRHLVQGV